MKEEFVVIHKDEVLLVSGPASVRKFEGEIYCLGKNIEDYPVIVRKGKVLPFETNKEASSLKILLSNEASYEIQKENIGCNIWKEDVEKKINEFGKEIKKILIIGPVDSGKSTLTTFLLNLSLRKNLKIGIVDGDVGQADLTPPGFIGCKVLKEGIFDLRDIVADYIIPVGIINVAQFEDLIIKKIKKGIEILKDLDLIIINTDGYVYDGGINYKLKLAEHLEPNLIFLLSDSILIKKFKEKFDEKVIQLKPATGIKKSKLIRTLRREMQYNKFLISATKSLIKVNEIKIGFLDKIFEEKVDERGCILSLKSKEKEKIRIISSYKEAVFYNKFFNTIDITTRALEGMFIGIEKENKITGFGLIENISYEKIRILSPIKPPFEKIWLSLIKLTEKGERKLLFVNF